MSLSLKDKALKIADFAAAQYEVAPGQAFTKSRFRPAPDIRRIICVILHTTEPGKSLEQIGATITLDYDHATVLYHIGKHDDLMTTDDRYREIFNRVQKKYEEWLRPTYETACWIKAFYSPDIIAA